MSWITADDVARLLGPSSSWEADLELQQWIVDASNAWAFRKRREAGYVDDPVNAPGPDIEFGTALYAVALFRERASTDGYASFEDLGSFQPTGGSMGQIRKLLGIGRAQTDTLGPDVYASPYGRRRVRLR